MKSKHNRKLVISGLALVKGRIKHDVFAIAEVRNEVEKKIIENNMLEDTPFLWIGLIIEYGSKTNLVPSYERINKKYGDLPIAVEVPMADLVKADRETLKQIFMNATVEAIKHVIEKYDLPKIDF